ncbi:UDP-N-acetylglucosamine 1-carboxyvinyltransferase [Vulgatibacter incomptus]|uniref:UDP-N-acetylglucosamine 1-carboxyvinyltransferase n=1 Tax=Vulgatibacter incomptus TaxID=1391653 RepID=A0A0K1PFR1_9BACT|nr:UDP-N-acetylglucosamine 1-carboxyvinyltransferase [Vulgatibacter incomptus]AKU91954.1 UDP-N-acetylglucosamine 1-carboxyvinyltransferase [Vulgatibacter incomptus]
MDSIVIKGGKRLEGTVKVSGAKNAALPLLASSLLAEGASTFRNVPELADIATMGKLLSSMGCGFERGTGRKSTSITVTVPPAADLEPIAPYELVKTMRASVLVLGPLVARYGKARVSLPGGCAIGARPIDQHLMGLEKLGATISLEHGYVQAKARSRRLTGARINFDVATVTGTENLIMAAALAKGTTVLENAAREPEVEDLARSLNAMGAQIEGAGTDRIEIQGVDSLQPADHDVIPDRIEAGTFLVAAAITGGDVFVEGCVPDHLEVVIEKLREAGALIEARDGGVRVRGPKRLKAVDVKTQPFPGFPTDMQAQLMVAMAVAEGSSVVTENVFENRYMHVQELSRMGANIAVDGKTAIVKGSARLSGAPVMATDLRASASLVLAGLCAEGTTTVQRVYHLDRGYQRIEKKLRALGAEIRRVKA